MTNNDLVTDSSSLENKDLERWSARVGGIKRKYKADLVLKFANGIRSGEVKFLNVLFHRSDHGRGPADKEFAVALVRVAEMVFDMIFGDETDASLPGRRGIIEDKIDLETVGMELGELVQVFLEEDIVVIDIGVDEADFSRVAGVAKNSADDLKHGGDASTSSNHAYVFAETRGVDEIALGAFEAHSVTDFESGHNARNVAFFVGLDKIRKEARREILEKETLIMRSKHPGSLSLLTGV
jgi:hypothetical protein